MPQVFQVLQCYSCKTFQVDIVKKVAKWVCKLCGEKQSIIKVYSRGNGKECRLYVQELNEKRIKLENGIHCEIPIECTNTNIECDVHLIEETQRHICIDQRSDDSSSQFKENLKAEESINSVDSHDSKCRLMCRGIKHHLNEEECKTPRASVSKWNEFILTDINTSDILGQSIDRNYTDSESYICNIGQVSNCTIDKQLRQSKWDEFSEPSLHTDLEDINSDSRQNVMNESVLNEHNKKIKWDKLPESENYTNGGKNIQYKSNLFQSADIDLDSILKL